MLQASQIAVANAHVRTAIDQAIDAGDEIGIQVVAYLDGQEVIRQAVGLADPQGSRRVEDDTLFNVYSVTKAVAVTALHLQVERGLVDYDAPVACYWPEFGVNGKETCTVRDVVTHASGSPQMPEGTTVEDMCDWDLMVDRIAQLTPIAPPGSQATYQAVNHGWLVGEIVRRTDSANRDFGQFVRDEICEPLQAPDLWIGVSPEAETRIATLVNATPPPAAPRTGLSAAAMPMNLSLTPEVFERPDVRRAVIPSVGGIFSAASCARFWAMLAQGGELDGKRLLSQELVATFNRPRKNAGQGDPVMFGRPLQISIGGFWLGGHETPVCAARNPEVICHPGAGNSIAWADPVSKLAVAICHNRMFQPPSRDRDPLLPVADAVRTGLGLQ